MEKNRTALEQKEHARELWQKFDSKLTALGFEVDAEGWADDLDLTDPNNAEVISIIIGNILLSVPGESKKDQIQKLVTLIAETPEELSMVRSLIILFERGIRSSK